MDKLQQIEQILDNAPEGATHYDSIVYYKARFNDISLNSGWDVFDTGYGKWESVGDCYLTDVYKIKDLSGLRTQLALTEENEKLKAQIKGSAWTRVEEVDYKPHHICNFCHNDLSVEEHEDDCVIKELSND